MSEAERARLESRALKLSAVAYLLMAALGIGFFFQSRSEAILVDGIYSLVSLAMTLIAQRVAGLVETPQTRSFHFGFAHFEPLLNSLRILLILGIGLYALASATEALFHGGRPLSTGPAVIYGALAAAGCLMMAAGQRRAARRTASPVLQVDSRNWLVDGLLSSGVFLSFLFAYFIDGTGLAHWIPYVDPVLVVALVLVILPVPVRTLAENLRQVLMEAPEPAMQADIRGRVEQAVDCLKPDLVYVRMLPTGRFLYLQVHVVLSHDHEVGSIEKLDTSRTRIESALSGIHPRLVLDVMFTADKRWVVLTEEEAAAHDPTAESPKTTKTKRRDEP